MKKVDMMMSNIFYNIEPKVINTELACLLGLNEAIVLQQMHYWLEKNKAKAKNYHDNRFWTYGSLQEYRDRDFKFWSFNTVKRTIAKLTERGFLLASNYNKIRLDQTKWYSIDYEALDAWLSQQEAQSPNNSILDNASAHNEPMKKPILSHSTGSFCPTPLAQNESMQQPTVSHTIEDITQRTSQKRLDQHSPPVLPPPWVEVIKNHSCLFDDFWAMYPRKESKKQAQQAWSKLNPTQALFNQIANALEYRCQTKEWLAEGGRYIPHPATWLNGRRWEDEQSQENICQENRLHKKYNGILVNGKPLDPIQRKQLEYIESQTQASWEGVF